MSLEPPWALPSSRCLLLSGGAGPDKPTVACLLLSLEQIRQQCVTANDQCAPAATVPLVDVPTTKILFSRGSYGDHHETRSAFNAAFASSVDKIIRRESTSCAWP